MFKKLMARWKVNGINLVLIIATFALGGSLCGYAGRKLLLLTSLERGVPWILLYILLITLLWPVCVLLISIPLGQFVFFRKYINKIWNKFNGKAKVKADTVTNIAIFASGTGSNAEKIINHFAVSSTVKIALIVCNKPGAGVLKIAESNSIPSLLIEKERFFNGDHYLPDLVKRDINFIVLAGFLWKMPSPLINTWPKKIINIHPALLPKYGGKGMYGMHVHESVIAAGEKQSGITIHYVDELYDHGQVIFQATCDINEKDTAELLAQKIHTLEHDHYPGIIDGLIEKQNRS